MSNFSKTLTAIMNERNLKRADFTKNLDIGESTQRGWINGKEPSVEIALKVAQYLGVSLDYLATGKSDDFFLASDEKNLVLLFRAMKPQDRELLFDFCEMLLKRQKKVNIGYATERDEALKVAEKED